MPPSHSYPKKRKHQKYYPAITKTFPVSTKVSFFLTKYNLLSFTGLPKKYATNTERGASERKENIDIAYNKNTSYKRTIPS